MTNRKEIKRDVSTSWVVSSELSSSSRWFCFSPPRLLSPERGASFSIQQKIQHCKDLSIKSQRQIKSDQSQNTSKGFIMTNCQRSVLALNDFVYAILLKALFSRKIAHQQICLRLPKEQERTLEYRKGKTQEEQQKKTPSIIFTE